jgi:drug/metabolite transporter (DMT)-like permease
VRDAATLGGTAPIFVVLLARPLLGERVSAAELLAVALGFSGIVAVVRPSLFGSARLSPLALAQLDRLGLSARGRARRRSRPGDHDSSLFPASCRPSQCSFRPCLVLTYALALPVFGDRPTAWQVCGSLLVVGASVVLALSHDPLKAAVRA